MCKRHIIQHTIQLSAKAALTIEYLCLCLLPCFTVISLVFCVLCLGFEIRLNDNMISTRIIYPSSISFSPSPAWYKLYARFASLSYSILLFLRSICLGSFDYRLNDIMISIRLNKGTSFRLNDISISLKDTSIRLNNISIEQFQFLTFPSLAPPHISL